MKQYKADKWMTSMPRKQDGVVLIVCLVILLVVTLLGVSNMQSSSMQLKMAKNSKDRQTAFQAAEITLRHAEDEIVAAGHLPDTYKDCDASASDCYTATCAGGRCFLGEYVASDSETDCEVFTGSATTPVWARTGADSIWASTANHQTHDIPGNADLPAGKYIVEFMCYGDKNLSASCEIGAAENCAALYRITSLATSEDNSARVMLQSMVKVVYQ